jgi:hypothetical protein
MKTRARRSTQRHNARCGDQRHLPINCAMQHRIARLEAKFRVTFHFGLV